MRPKPNRRSKLPVDILVFDGDCAFCTGVARWVSRRLPPGARTLPWQRLPDPAAYGLTTSDVAAAAYWIDGRGRPFRGHLAVARALQRMGGGWRLVGDLIEVPPVSWLARAAYEGIARNRHRLPGPTPACRTDGPAA